MSCNYSTKVGRLYFGLSHLLQNHTFDKWTIELHKIGTECVQAIDSLSRRSGSVTMVTPEFCDLWNLRSSDLMAWIRGVAGSGILAGSGGLEDHLSHR